MKLPGWPQHWRRWTLGAAAVLCAATFLAPGVPWTRQRVEHVVVIDITQSMNVVDQQVEGRPASRLAAVHHVLGEVLQSLPCGSRLGWAVFTEYRSFLLTLPLEVCANRAELRGTLARIDGRMAWSGNSEVAKGLHAAIAIARDVPSHPSIVFLTDGQEAPPLSAGHRPHFDDKPGEVPGLLVGVGDLVPSPIPKIDPSGRPLGVWGPDDVLQTDPRQRGRGASVSGEAMVDDPAGAQPAPGATPGREHLSGLRETYLQLLADENGLAYQRLTGAEALLGALQQRRFERPVPTRADLRIALGAAAWLLLIAPELLAWLRRRRAR